MDPLRDPTCYWLFIRKRKRKIERNFISNSAMTSSCKQDDASLVAKDSCTTHSVVHQTTTNNLQHSEQYNSSQSILSESRELQLLHSIHGDSLLPTNTVQLEHVHPQGSSPTQSSRRVTMHDEASQTKQESSEQFASTVKKDSSNVQSQDENANATSNHPPTSSNSSSRIVIH